MGKLDALSDFVAEESVKVLGIGETWLLNSDSSSFVTLNGYTFVRSDVGGNVRKHGAGLYVADYLKYEEVVVDQPNVIIVRLTDLELVLIVVYRPPSYKEVDNNNLANILINYCIGSEVLILGDFNLPSLKWDSDLPSNYMLKLDREFLEIFTSLGLTQWVQCPTYVLSDNILDLIFTSEGDRVGEVRVCPPLPGGLHSPVLCDYIFQFGVEQEEVQFGEGYAWHKGNYEQINRVLLERDWNWEFAYRSPNECFIVLKNIILALTDIYIPIKQNKSSAPWRVNPPRALKKLQKDAWSSYKEVRRRYGRNHPLALGALSDFSSANRDLKNFSLASRCTYEKNLIAKLLNLSILILEGKRKGVPQWAP